jgi:hypothetical protein
MYGHWITQIEFNPDNYVGFVYLVTNNLTDQKYIGKKNFKVGTKVPDLWKYYISSSKYLKEDILKFGKENFKFEILHLCTDKNELDSLEIKIQIERNVLKSQLFDGVREYYNRYIHKVGLSTNGLKFSLKSRQKMTKSRTGVPHADDKTIYRFKNTETSEIQHWTRKEFYKIVGADPCKLVIGKAKSVRKWVCLNPRENTIRKYTNRK